MNTFLEWLYSPSGQRITLALALLAALLFVVMVWYCMERLFAPKPPQDIRDHRVSREVQRRRQRSLKLPYRHWIGNEESSDFSTIADARRIELLDNQAWERKCDDWAAATHDSGEQSVFAGWNAKDRYLIETAHWERLDEAGWRPGTGGTGLPSRALTGETLEADIIWDDDEADPAQEAFLADPLGSWLDPALLGMDMEPTEIALDTFDSMVDSGQFTSLGVLGSLVPGEMPAWTDADDEAFRKLADSLELAAA